MSTLSVNEFDTVELLEDLAERGLSKGTVGAVVYVYQGGAAYEVEFVNPAGDTIDVTTVTRNQIRPVRSPKSNGAKKRAAPILPAAPQTSHRPT